MLDACISVAAACGAACTECLPHKGLVLGLGLGGPGGLGLGWDS